MSQDFLNKLAKILDSQLGNEKFGVSELANEIGLSRSQLHRKLQNIAGKSTSQFIREYRLNKALEMLQAEEATASEVAYTVGFNSPSYFNTSFKDYFGFTPGDAKTATVKAKPIEEMKKSSGNFNFFNSIYFRVAVILIFAIAVGYGLFKTFNNPSEVQTRVTEDSIEIPEEKTVAIMPFKSLSSLEENEFFTEGVRQDIIDNLSRINNVVVKSQQSVAKLKESNLPIKELGETLGIDYLVGGNVQRYEDRVKIRVHLTDTKKDVQIWSQDFDREYKDIFTLESDISRKIAYELDLILTPKDLEKFDKIPTTNLEAYKYYNKGRFHLYRDHFDDSFNLALEYFEKSVELDPEFAMGYSSLAETNFWKYWPSPSFEEMQVMKQYALKAIELDNNLSYPHQVLGWYYMNYEKEWDKAEDEIKLSIKLQPNNHIAYCIYAQYIYYTLGDFTEAQHMLDKALIIFPNSFYVNVLIADFNSQVGNYARALEHADLAEEYAPSDLWPYWIRFLTYANMGKDDLAVRELEEGWNIYQESRRNIAPMKNAYEKDGIEGVFKWINDIDINQPDSAFVNYNAFWIAQKFGYLGDTDSTIKWLNIAYDNNNADMFRIKYDSAFNFLHENPDFLKLLEKLKLGDYKSNTIEL